MILNPDVNFLKKQLDLFYLFTQTDKLVINEGKFSVIHFSQSKKLDFPLEFTIGGSQILEVKKSHNILGVIVLDDLKQVQEIVRRATKTKWLLRRMRAIGVKQASLVEYWKNEGCVHLEASCPV